MQQNRQGILVLFFLFLGACAGSESGPETAAPEPEVQIGSGNEAEERPETAAAALPIGFSGLSRAGMTLQRQAESRLQALCSAERCDQDLKELTRLPHVAGSARNAELAVFLTRSLEKSGFQVERKSYEVLLPYPRSITVEMEQPVAFSAGLTEEAADWDLDTKNPAILPYSAYSPDCDLSAPVVYANYGRREDFEKLAELGVSLRGVIVLVRYGHIFRGVKVALAEEYGAAGVIIYSDPADDGHARGDVYPKGPFRPFTGVERGSILRIWDYPGDPGTPGRPSLPGAAQLNYGDMKSLPNLPTTAISAADAAPIIEHLGGLSVPDGWQGALPSTYHLGGVGKVRLRLRIESDYALRRIENVIGTLPGIKFPDEYVVLGNHRDAWVHGAIDPGSGTAVLLEVARVLGAAKVSGQQLNRSVRICFWDAEEFGMIGSTEYGEERAQELQAETVAYINVDAAVSGPNLRVAGVPSLRGFVTDLLTDLKDHQGKAYIHSLRDPKGRLQMPSLGSGSDYTVFLDHLGIPAIDFSSGGSNGVYHSSYDSYVFMKRFGDPGFKTHELMAKLIATCTSRLGRAELLPFDFAAAGQELKRTAERMEKAHPELELAEIVEIADAAMAAGERINKARSAQVERNLSIETTMNWNAALARMEAKLLLDGGLAARPWYRHALYAPSPDRGYGTDDLPPLADALRRKDRDHLQREALRLITTLRVWLTELERLASSMES